ncbi:MAG: fibronectin type III domain-containing protein, partial [Verrucomicrobiota bacterium]
MKRFMTPGGPYTAIATGLTETRYTDLTTDNDMTYHYVVTAVSASGESKDSYAASATPAFVLDAGFEALRVRSYQANPSGDAWTFSARSGLSANGTDMTADCPSAPQANQVAYLQSGGTIAQSLTHLTPGTKYQMTFAAAQRVSPSGTHAWSVQLDGKDLWVFGPVGTTFTDCYTNYSVVFTATAASHTLTLVGPATGEDTVFLDDVRVAPLRDRGPLAAPAKLTASAVSSTAIKLEWSASPGASGYLVKRAATAGGPYTTVAANVSPMTYTNIGLTQGTGYCYVVAAANSDGAGPDSAPASATPTTEADSIVGDWSFLDSRNPGWHVERGWGRSAAATPAGMRIGTPGANPPEGMINVAAPAGLAFVNSGIEMIFTAHDLGPANRSFLSIRDRHGNGVGLGTVSGKLFLRAWGSENPPANREVDAAALVDGMPHALALVCLD